MSNQNGAGRRDWTPEQVRALGVRTDLVTACQIVYGCGKNKAWELYHAAQLDFPALKVGRRVVVPVVPLLQLLGIGPETNGPGTAIPGTATYALERTTRDDGTAERPAAA